MKVQIRQLEGRDHYVVPTVLITVGLHTGSMGRVYYFAGPLAQSVPFWNGKPVVVYHPEMDGKTPAGSPSIFNQQKVGVLFNTQFDGRRLKAESWLDVERCRTIDIRIEEAIKEGRVMEVSTGMFSEYSTVLEGLVADEIFPDHLALLPDQRGACSIADGAGLLVNTHFHSPFYDLSLPLFR